MLKNGQISSFLVRRNNSVFASINFGGGREIESRRKTVGKENTPVCENNSMVHKLSIISDLCPMETLLDEYH